MQFIAQKVHIVANSLGNRVSNGLVAGYDQKRKDE